MVVVSNRESFAVHTQSLNFMVESSILKVIKGRLLYFQGHTRSDTIISRSCKVGYYNFKVIQGQTFGEICPDHVPVIINSLTPVDHTPLRLIDVFTESVVVKRSIV